jgi:N6-adenosine-specific RNA methylase IME4
MTTEIIINPELRDWIIPLKPEEYSQLEKSILSEGCRDPIVLWNGVVVDGHHRYKICTEHNISFKTIEKSFEDIDAAKIWMVDNQLARRNLEPIQRVALVMKGEELVARKAKENKVIAGTLFGENHPKEEVSMNSSNALKDTNIKTIGQSTLQIEPTLGGATKKEIGEDLVKPINQQTTPKVITPIHTRKEMAKRAGVSEQTYDRAKKVLTVLKEKSPEVFDKVVQQGKAAETSAFKSINKNYSDIVREEKKIERQKEIEDNPVLPDGKYNVILADPPWMYNFSETVKRDIDTNHYPTMELENIKNLALPIEDNAILLLWATAPKLEEAIEVLNAWGFVYKTNAIWDKEKIGMGYWFRGQHELLLVGVKGDFKSPEPENRYSSVIRSTRGEHSSKPEIVYEMVEKMFPNRKYLEVFARNNRPGWVSWGNQV